MGVIILSNSLAALVVNR